MVFNAVQEQATVEFVRPMATNTWVVRLKAPEIAKRMIPGQFFMVRPASGSDPLLGRPFALYDICHDSNGVVSGLEFGFVTVGKMTSLMQQWTPGETVQLWGPLGNGFPPVACEHLICVAGGIGQTPFRAVMQEALGNRIYGHPPNRRGAKPVKATLLYGVRSKDYLAGLDDFRIPGLEVQIATDDGTAGHPGYVTELLKQQLNQRTDGVHVYCCGPEPMMHAVATECARRGVRCWLSLETPMACGFGACFSCVTKVKEPDGSWDYRRTCVEGPVFDASTLVFSE
ncbi:MAG: dihydroorotate dehydrogenase electron transfer subunit [Planctomyces sp.]|nr:dihydroorotate dehydrogenase electron transfer subunit [Planctomyces sp.]